MIHLDARFVLTIIFGLLVAFAYLARAIFHVLCWDLRPTYKERRKTK